MGLKALFKRRIPAPVREPEFKATLFSGGPSPIVATTDRRMGPPPPPLPPPPGPKKKILARRRKRQKRKYREDFHLREKVLYLMNTVDSASLDKLTYSLDNILIDCSFGGKQCDAEDFVRIMNPRLGACYIFNTGLNTSRRAVHNSGSLAGLELTLFVDQANYLPNVASVAGYKVLIHSPDEPPMPDEDGLVLQPGKFTSYGLKMSEFERAEAPYGRCKRFTRADNRSLNMFLRALPHTAPSLEVCIRTCEQLQIIRRCRCYSLHHGYADAPAFDAANASARARPCNVSVESVDFNCSRAVEVDVSEGRLTCKSDFCRHQECVSARYEISQSSADWPSENSMNEFIYWMRNVDNSAIRRPLRRRYIKANFLKFLVYFEDLNVIHFKTEPAYTLIDFLSDLGGQGGLWLGISAFTLVELAVLLGDLTRVAVCRSTPTPTQGESPSEPPDAAVDKEDAQTPGPDDSFLAQKC